MPNPTESLILSILEGAREAGRPITGRNIADIAGLKLRQVQREIKRMVEGGEHPILSTSADPPGYFIAGSAEEVRDCAKGLRHRGISCLVRASRLHAMAARLEAEWPVQVEMFARSNFPA